MIYEDPREDAPEIEDDQQKPRDHEKENKSEKEETDDAHQYTDWASI